MRFPRALVLVLLASCGAEPPVTHTVRVEAVCGSCAPVAPTVVDGTVFAVDDGRLSLFTDFAVGDGRMAMLEVVGIAGPSPEVRYHEVADGNVVLVGEIDSAHIDVRRLGEEARVEGTIALELHDRDSSLARSYPRIRVFPADMVPPSGGASGGGSGGGSSGGSTHVTVVVAPRPVYVESGGCESSSGSDSGGCEGDTTSDSGGCEGDTSSSSGGCEGDTSSSGGCEGDTSSGGCEGDTASSGGGCDGGSASGCEGASATASRSAVPGLFRLTWPIAIAGFWNRWRRRRTNDLQPS